MTTQSVWNATSESATLADTSDDVDWAAAARAQNELIDILAKAILVALEAEEAVPCDRQPRT